MKRYKTTNWWSATLLLCGVLLAVPQTSSAALDPAKPLRQFIIRNWQAEQGLPQNSILSIAQTRDGYLWLGTEEGLARYDGVRFVTFDAGNSGLKDNVVRALLVDKQNTLWIGTQSGGLFIYKDGQFRSVPMPPQVSHSIVNSLFEDHRGSVWAGTYDSGLLQFSAGTYRRFTTADGLAGNEITALSEGRDGTLWIGTRKGLCRLKDGRLFPIGQADGLASNDIRAVTVDYEGKVWIGTAKGLNRIDSGVISTFTSKDGLTGNDITVLTEDSAHSLWIGTGGSGLNRLVQGRFSSLATGALNGTDIVKIFEDTQGDLWIGTGGHGIISLKEGPFTTLTVEDGLADNMTLPVLEDRKGNVWVGSEHGLTRLSNGRPRKFTKQDGLTSDFIFSLAQDASGAILAGTQEGVFRIAGETVRPLVTKGDLPNSVVFSLYVDRQTNVWIGTRDGLSRYDGRKISKEGLADSIVWATQEDHSGTLWAGTPSGLSSFVAGKFHTYTTADGLPSNSVLAIYCDSDDVLWLATSKGLARFHSGRATTFGKLNRILEGTISAVLEDQAGFLWLASNRGIVRVSRRELNRYAAGASGQEVHLTFFNTSDGMKSAECNGAFQPAGWVGQTGQLYFPTVAGLAITKSAQVGTPRGGRLVVERLTINNLEFRPQVSPKVPAGSGKLEIEFASPDVHFENKVHFRYFLEGFDKDWIDSGTRRIAYYTNIPHGEYRFRVQSGVDGIWNENFVSPLLTLEPHFYETRTFFFFVTVAFATVIGAIYRVRMDQIASRELKLRTLVDERTSALRKSESELRRSHDQLELRVKERTRELTHVNRSLEEEVQTRRQTEELLILAKEAAESANRAKGEFLANISHELRTPINGIMGMTELALGTELNAEQTEYLEVAKVSADSLLSLVNDVLDFSKIEARKLSLEHIPFSFRKTVTDVFRSFQPRAESKALEFALSIDDSLPDHLLGDPLRIRQVLLNLIDNAIKFTAKGAISIAATFEHQPDSTILVHVQVEDSGIGIAPDKTRTIFEAFSQADNSSTRRYGGTGLGLTISYELARLHGGNLWVESELGRGSTFHFTARVHAAGPPSGPEAPQCDASITV